MRKQEEEFGTDKESQEGKKQFSSSVKFGRGFWENLTEYEKRQRKEIQRNQFLTPYMKSELLESLETDLAKEVASSHEERLRLQASRQIDEESVKKQPADTIIRRSDLSSVQKIQGIYFNENLPDKLKFFVLSDLSAEKGEAITIIPNMQFVCNHQIKAQMEYRNSQIEYPLGLPLDPNYMIVTPRIKKIYGLINPKATLDLVRFSQDPDSSTAQKVLLSPQDYHNSFGKSALFIRGAYIHFTDIKDTLFRFRNYDYKSPTLHYTWDRNCFKYFTFSLPFYQ